MYPIAPRSQVLGEASRNVIVYRSHSCLPHTVRSCLQCFSVFAQPRHIFLAIKGLETAQHRHRGGLAASRRDQGAPSYCTGWRFSAIRCLYGVCIYGVCTVFAWCLYGVCTVFVWGLYGVCTVFVWCLYGVYTVFLWCLYGAYMVFVVYGICTVFVRCFYGVRMVCVVFVWCVYGVCMVCVWCLCNTG